MHADQYRCIRCDGIGSLEPRAEAERAELVCTRCHARYPISRRGQPILLSPDNELFDRDAYVEPAATQPPAARAFIPQPSVNLSQERVIGRLGELLASRDRPRVLVVGAGRQRQNLTSRLTSRGLTRLDLVCTDIDRQADVDCFCDAHEVPFPSASFDAVITTAVLEHVLYPETVAAEIARVVRVGGYVYSELPFMQQVHEGAYDFTRYTLSGHRRLLNQFRELEAGAVAGPGTALVWALESFAAAWFKSSRLSRLARLGVRAPFFWLKYCDYLIAGTPAGLDGSSCTYLLGERVEKAISGSTIIAQYRGARSVTHT